MANYAPYQALSTEAKLAMVRDYPPNIGESQEAYYLRVTGTGGGAYSGGPRVDAPLTYGMPIGNGAPGNLVASQANGGSANVVSGVGQALIALGVPAAAIAGLSGTALAALGAVYGITQAIGLQYPWETGPGEGFIAPWSRDIVQDESGRWVTAETRPDLFGVAAPAGNGRGATAMVAVQGQLLNGGSPVVKMWDTGYTDSAGQYHPGWPFAMTADGYIHTVTRTGLRKKWRPYRSVVLGKKMNQGMALRAVRKLQGIKDLAYRIEDLAGAGMKHTVKRSKKK